jgi:hypothetical protein
MQREATAVLALVVKKETDKARAKVLESLPPLTLLQKTMAGTMTKLYGLKNDFADMAGVA